MIVVLHCTNGTEVARLSPPTVNGKSIYTNSVEFLGKRSEFGKAVHICDFLNDAWAEFSMCGRLPVDPFNPQPVLDFAEWLVETEGWSMTKEDSYHYIVHQAAS